MSSDFKLETRTMPSLTGRKTSARSSSHTHARARTHARTHNAHTRRDTGTQSLLKPSLVGFWIVLLLSLQNSRVCAHCWAELSSAMRLPGTRPNSATVRTGAQTPGAP